jgi:hypothetical protein
MPALSSLSRVAIVLTLSSPVFAQFNRTPTVKISANPTSIAAGNASTLTVVATNALKVTIAGSDGSSYTLPDTGGTESVSPASTTTYTVTAVGAITWFTATAKTTVTVTAALPSIPADAISSGDLDSDAWFEAHDSGTPGSSTGSTTYPATLAAGGYSDVLEFNMTYTDRAGERWSYDFGDNDSTSTHFVIDTDVYFPVPSEILNLEIDVNQVTADGMTHILSTQCAGAVNSWEVGDTVGTSAHWESINIPCNPANWQANVWHHVQIGEERGTGSAVILDWLILDNQYYPLNVVRNSALSLDWALGVVNTQFQIEGSSTRSGAVTAYVHNFTVYRW